MELATVKTEFCPRNHRMFMMEGGNIDMKCTKRRRRDSSVALLEGNEKQEQSPQGGQPTTVKRSSRFRRLHVTTIYQDAHRQRIVDWINATSGTAGAFDVTTKGILHSALERCEYWRLSDPKGKPLGVLGWWPSRAVTFIENHDTGSTQGHWRFPSGKEMQGYAYILTHPGTPSVFFDHIFSHYRSEIGTLISLRKRNKIHCRSRVQILKAETDVYAAIVDKKLAMKIGPGHFEPPSRSSGGWSLACEGRDYKLWEASS